MKFLATPLLKTTASAGKLAQKNRNPQHAKFSAEHDLKPRNWQPWSGSFKYLTDSAMWSDRQSVKFFLK